MRKLRYCLTSLLLATALFSSIFALIGMLQYRANSLELELTPVLVNKIAQEPLALVVVKVDWALPAVPDDQIRMLVAEHNRTKTNNIIRLYFVNVTRLHGDYRHLRNWAGWDEIAANGNPLEGHGELIWLTKGKLVSVTRTNCLNECGFGQLFNHVIDRDIRPLKL